jgi:GDP-4-dehydro-6-deoxy-D-mannose reductase
MRAFVTGATGFAGSHLIDDLIAGGNEVFSLVHLSSSHQPIPQNVLCRGIPGDLLDRDGLKTAVRQAEPDVIFHLAGQASPSLSWKDPGLTLRINAVGTANLLEAAVTWGRPRVVVVTSAEVYGQIRPEMLPLTEETPSRPHHPYGVSKVAAGQLVSIYWQRYRLPVVEARPFNHVGPRQALGFVVPDFASQLAAIKLGRQEAAISVGNLNAERDFSDVRDVVRAYRRLAEAGQPGESYLICSGQAVPIHYLLTTLIELAGVAVEVRYDPDRMRPSDTPTLYGSYAKLRRDTGWQPQVHLRQSLADAMDDWVERLQSGALPPR